MQQRLNLCQESSGQDVWARTCSKRRSFSKAGSGREAVIETGQKRLRRGWGSLLLTDQWINLLLCRAGRGADVLIGASVTAGEHRQQDWSQAAPDCRNTNKNEKIFSQKYHGNNANKRIHIWTCFSIKWSYTLKNATIIRLCIRYCLTWDTALAFVIHARNVAFVRSIKDQRAPMASLTRFRLYNRHSICAFHSALIQCGLFFSPFFHFSFA